MAKASGSIDLKSLKIAGEPNKYVTFIDSTNGIRVHKAGETNSNFAQINSYGLQVYKGGQTDSYKIAEFGETSYIGKHDGSQSYMRLDSNALQMIDKEGHLYFEVKDLRENGEFATVSESFPILASENNPSLPDINTYYVLKGSVAATSNVIGVKINGTSVSNWQASVQPTGMCIKFTSTSGLTVGDIATVSYQTSGSNLKALTFGSRGSSNLYYPGGYSVAMGDEVIAEGDYSFASGYHTKAYGIYSAAMGIETVTGRAGQLVIGEYNEKNNDALFVIGNGTSTNTRSNLMVVGDNLVRIGNKENTHTEILPNGMNIMTNNAIGMRMSVGGDDTILLNVTRIADGSTTTFYINDDHSNYVCPTSYSVISAFSVTINDKEADTYNPRLSYSESSIGVNGPTTLTITSVYFQTPPPANAIIKFCIGINGANHIDIGTPYINQKSQYGINSMAIGSHSQSTGHNSIAVGQKATASAYSSAAFNFATAYGLDSFAANNGGASSNSSAAFNYGKAYADNSFANGYATASSNYQTAIGKYNKLDTNGDYVFIIGNGSGTAEENRSNALTVDWNGNITMKSHSSPIGTIKRGEPSAAVSVPDKTFKALCSVSLEAGTWIVICTVRAPSNATGFRMANLATTAAVNACNACIPAVSANVTQFDFTKIVEPTEPTPYYLNVYHNAGTSLIYPTGSTNYITAIRIL